ncbi:MAG: hypothetical protein ACOX66_03895 [Oscillospiraceae bacterium]|jgi:hypothetical protein
MTKFMGKLKKHGRTMAMVGATAAATMVPAFAEGASTDLNAALTTGLQSASSSIMGTLGSVLPIALGILAAIFGVKYGIRFFKSIAKG